MCSKLTDALEAIDAVNATDPKRGLASNGNNVPEALLYGRRMSAELERLFSDDVSEVLKITCRGQHIER